MLDAKAREMLKAPHFAAVSTLLKSGMPITHVMWIDCDDEHVLINTEIHRAKYANLKRDPRISVAVWDRADPYIYIEMRGRMVEEVRGSAAREHIDELSMKYDGRPYQSRIRSERVVLKVEVDKIRSFASPRKPAPG